MAVDRVRARSIRSGAPAVGGEQLPRRLRAVGRVHAAAGDPRVQPGIMQDCGDRQHLAVDRPLPLPGELGGNVPRPQRVPFHRAVGHPGRGAQARERLLSAGVTAS